jgi:hypothetical protein
MNSVHVLTLCIQKIVYTKVSQMTSSFRSLRLQSSITSPCRPDRLWGPPNLLYNGYQDLFPGGKVAGV